MIVIKITLEHLRDPNLEDAIDDIYQEKKLTTLRRRAKVQDSLAMTILEKKIIKETQ